MLEINPKRYLGTLKVLMIVPASQSESMSMIFARRQIDSIEKASVEALRFFLEPRTSFTKLWHSLHALHKGQLHFKPDLVCAYCCAMTPFFSFRTS